MIFMLTEPNHNAEQPSKLWATIQSGFGSSKLSTLFRHPFGKKVELVRQFTGEVDFESQG